MERKRYSNYAQIDQDLKILKIAKEIEFQKLVMNFEFARENLKPHNMVRDFLKSLPEFSWKDVVRHSSGSLSNMAIPMIMGWLAKKKRGH